MFLIKLNDRITRILMIVAAVWAFCLTFIIMSDIIGRGVFNAPVYGVREIVMNSIVIIVFLQAGYAVFIPKTALTNLRGGDDLEHWGYVQTKLAF